MPTAGGWRVVACAVVAAKLMLLLVVGKAHIAVIALWHPATCTALPERYVAPPVLEQDRLLTMVQRRLDPFNERG